METKQTLKDEKDKIQLKLDKFNLIEGMSNVELKTQLDSKKLEYITKRVAFDIKRNEVVEIKKEMDILLFEINFIKINLDK